MLQKFLAGHAQYTMTSDKCLEHGDKQEFLCYNTPEYKENSVDSKTKDALKQLQAEVRQLQASLSQKRPGAEPDSPGEDRAAKTPRGLVSVQYTVAFPAAGDDGKAPRPHHSSFTELQLSEVSDEAAAAIGYALASPQKIGLLRALWGKESEGAAALGEATSLTTGSLYHHLRELMRADLVSQSGRNRYVLSLRGARVLPIVLALAAED